MPWKLKSAKYRGDKTNPAAGNTVIVVIENTDLIDQDGIVPVEVFTYGYDGTLTPGQWRKQVKAEIKAHMQHLNRADVALQDVTADFTPDD